MANATLTPQKEAGSQVDKQAVRQTSTNAEPSCSVPTLHLVGVGALGFQLAQEIAKRAAATDKRLRLCLYDDDRVEDRNVFSQGFSPKDIGKLKAEVAGEICSGYEGVEVIVRAWKVNKDTRAAMNLDSRSIIIDAVDNLPTRHFLWELGMGGACLHLGMAYTGTGEVGWNSGEYDHFTLSPNNMSPEQMVQLLEDQERGVQAQEIKLPPCDLNSSRALSLMTVHSALDSLWLFLGRDVSGCLPPELGLLRESPGVMTNWTCSSTGRQIQVGAREDIAWSTAWKV